MSKNLGGKVISSHRGIREGRRTQWARLKEAARRCPGKFLAAFADLPEAEKEELKPLLRHLQLSELS